MCGNCTPSVTVYIAETRRIPVFRQTMSRRPSQRKDTDTIAPRELRLRVYAGEAIAMGPGKADLLEAIDRTGSISGAGRELGMSYKRCWDLVETMNTSFREPLVATAAGGSRGGGTVLTDCGRKVLAQFRRMEQQARDAVADEMVRFRDLLR